MQTAHKMQTRHKTQPGSEDDVLQIMHQLIDHFTVVCSVSWPLNDSGAGDLCFDKDLCFCHVNTRSWHENNMIYKSSEARIKTRSAPALLPFKGE